MSLTLGALAAETRWREARRAARWRQLGCSLLGLLLFALALRVGEVDLARLARGLPMIADYIGRTIPRLRWESFAADLAEWFWGFEHWLVLLADTFLIAWTGTTLGAVAALLLSFPAATTLAPRPVVAATRRVLEFARTVPTLVYALIFVYAFGLGPLAGVLAIALHSMGALGKLFAETHENTDPRIPEAMRSAGANWPQACRYGVLPQSLPGVLSFGLLRLEINLREASVLGIVGAGGIGEELYLSVRQFEYPDISAILLLILASVILLDLACETLRHRIIGADAQAMT